LIVGIAFVESLAWIYSIWFVISIFAMMIMNVRTLIMTEIMTRDSNLQGNSTVLMILSIARIVAPFAGGLIAAVWAPRILLFLTSAIYLLATIIITKVSLERRGNAGIRSTQGIFHDILEGITCIVNDHSLRYLALIAVFWRLFLGLQISLFVVYVKSYFSLGSSAYGLFLTCAGLGSIAGSMIGPNIVKRVEPAKLIMWGMGVHYLTFAALGMIGNFSVALVTVLVSYAMFYSTLVGIHSIRDSVTRSEIRGRVYGSITAILTPAGIASMLLGGYLAGLFGVEKVMLAAGVLAFASLMLTRVVFSEQRIMILDSGQ
jgi:DHA3 family macrolide efflux protein-like MFS transporter